MMKKKPFMWKMLRNKLMNDIRLLGVVVFLTEIQLGFPISIIIITSAKEVTVYDSCLRFSKKLTILMTFLENN